MSARDWSQEKWQEVFAKYDETGGGSPQDLADLRMWVAENCYEGIGILRDLAEHSGDSKIKQYANVLDWAVRRQFAFEGDRYWKKLRQIESQTKITPEKIRSAYEQSRVGTIKEVAGIMDVRPDSLSRYLRQNPKHKFAKKNTA